MSSEAADGKYTRLGGAPTEFDPTKPSTFYECRKPKTDGSLAYGGFGIESRKYTTADDVADILRCVVDNNDG